MANKLKKKVASNATVADTKKKKVVTCEEWTNYNTFEKAVYTNLSMERLAMELIEWVRKEVECLKLNQFLEFKGIHKKTWNDWCRKYPALQQAHEHALMILGNRREVGVMTRKFEPTSTSFMMLHYDTDWSDVMKLKASVMNKDGENGGIKVVVLEKYPDSPMVPIKKGDDE